ncbi:MAG: hypothetical protein ACLR8Y_03815 [Alistipes indistinctus]
MAAILSLPTDRPLNNTTCSQARSDFRRESDRRLQRQRISEAAATGLRRIIVSGYPQKLSRNHRKGSRIVTSTKSKN